MAAFQSSILNAAREGFSEIFKFPEGEIIEDFKICQPRFSVMDLRLTTSTLDRGKDLGRYLRETEFREEVGSGIPDIAKEGMYCSSLLTAES